MFKTVIVAALFAIPALSFAQGQSYSEHRMQSLSQLTQLESVGYNPYNSLDYPHDLIRAKARLAQQEALAQAPNATVYGQR
ncbi:MAG: DUF4148 domain-containing protein [Janthinobacterium lividum]